ncbi:MAG: histidine--tRNA ligase [Dongiaceae bacterium]
MDYLQGHKARLSKDSLDRLDRNPLRILDSKDEGDRAIIAGAPVYSAHLNSASREFFRQVTDGLDMLGIPYRLDPRLVRGLDYYCHTCFEFTAAELGAQKTVMAGGRYDGLVETMGGPPTKGVGWASGIERVAMMLEGGAPAASVIAVIPVGEAATGAAFKLTEELRRAGFSVDVGFGGNVKKRLARADKMKAVAAVFLGDDELAGDAATVRDLASGSQVQVPLASLQDRLAAYRR